MSYNIRYATAPDGENAWERRKEFLAETITAFDPDLLGTQETLAGQRDFLAAKLPGHTAFALQSGAGRMMVMSDTTNHPALFVRNPDWAAIFDMDGDMARQTRRKLLDMAASEKTQVAFYHAPFPATGYIAKDGDKFRLAPVQWSAQL